MHKIHIILIVLLILLPQHLQAELVKFQFTGTVVQVTGNPYSTTITPFSSIEGEFLYETNTVAALGSNLAGTSDYLQSISHGFSATMDGNPVFANSYDIQVSNDFPQSGGGTADIVSVVFSSSLVPALNGSLNFNGIDHAEGLFSLNFSGSAGVFATSALPTTLNFSDYFFSNGILTQTPLVTFDTFYIVNTLVQVSVPEPVGLFFGLCLIFFLYYFLRPIRFGS